MNIAAWFWLSLLIVALSISIHATVLKSNNKDNRNFRLLVPMGFNVSLWLGCQFLIQVLQSDAAVKFVHEFKYVSILSLPSLLYMFSYAYRYQKRLSREMIIVFSTVPIPLIILIAFDHLTNLFRAEGGLRVNRLDDLVQVATDNGPFFYFISLFIYVIIFVSILNFIAAYKSQPSTYKNSERVLVIAILVPTCSNLVYQIGTILFEFYFDPTPIGFFLALLIFYYAVVFTTNHNTTYLRRGAMVEKMDEALLFLNHHGNVYDANQSFLQLVDTNLRFIADKPLNAIEIPLFKTLNGQLESDLPQTEYHFDHNGKDLFYQSTYKAIYSDKQKYLGSLFVLTDITSYKKTYLDLQYLTVHDALTGLYNRYHFNQEILRLNKYHYFPLGLFYIYLTDLKKTNDDSGHQQGDQLLVGLSKHLNEMPISNGQIFRTGSDEFTCLVSNTSQSEMNLIADQLSSLSPYFASNPLKITYAIKTSESQALTDFKREASN